MAPPEISREELRELLKEVMKEELTAAELADPEERKTLFKQAAKEVFQEHVARFGLWSIKTIGAALLLVVVYLIAWLNGWTK